MLRSNGRKQRGSLLAESCARRIDNDQIGSRCSGGASAAEKIKCGGGDNARVPARHVMPKVAHGACIGFDRHDLIKTCRKCGGEKAYSSVEVPCQRARMFAGDEIKHITNSWEERAAEYELFTKDPEVRRILDGQNVKRIGFRALRDLQRGARTKK